MAEKKLRNENSVIGSFGGGAVGYPNSSTSGRQWPSTSPGTASSGDGPRTEELPGARSGRRRGMGGGTASSSLGDDSLLALPCSGD